MKLEQLQRILNAAEQATNDTWKAYQVATVACFAVYDMEHGSDEKFQAALKATIKAREKATIAHNSTSLAQSFTKQACYALMNQGTTTTPWHAPVAAHDAIMA